jgi:SlyX protein
MTEATEAAVRLESLEIKLAHLERTAQELSDVIYRQQRQIDSLLNLNRQIASQLDTLEAKAGDAGQVEIPPHY